MSIGHPKPFAPAHRKLRLIISAFFILVVGVYAFLTAPRYVVLNIEAPDSYLPRGNWMFTSVSTISTYNYPDIPTSRYFVWRQEAEVRTQAHDPQSPFDSWQSLKKYFDDHLVDGKWTLYEYESYNPCISFLPEAKFLPRGENGYLIYRKPETINYAEEPTLCLASWPSWEENENVMGIML